jgi:hypothetical protein
MKFINNRWKKILKISNKNNKKVARNMIIKSERIKKRRNHMRKERKKRKSRRRILNKSKVKNRIII